MPDARGFIVIGLFSLTFYIFTLLAMNVHLAEVQLFGVLATAVISGGLGAATGYYFGSAKSGTDKDVTIAKALDKAP